MCEISKEQLEKLWKRQFGPYDVDENGWPIMFHPYTCENRGDGNHLEVGGDKGILVPTVNGWICPSCDYTQPYYRKD